MYTHILLIYCAIALFSFHNIYLKFLLQWYDILVSLQFQRFVKPQDIPSNFVDSHLTLRGRVLSIEPRSGSNSLLLFVEHQPVVAINWFRKPSKGLPVHLSGVDVSGNGVSWLQHVVVGENVNFRPLKVTPTCASCIVTTQVFVIN